MILQAIVFNEGAPTRLSCLAALEIVQTHIRLSSGKVNCSPLLPVGFVGYVALLDQRARSYAMM